MMKQIQKSFTSLVEEWANDKNQDMQLNTSNFEFQSEKFLDSGLSFLNMDSKVEYITFGRNKIFFVTNDKPYTINYMPYWIDSYNNENTLAKSEAEACYKTKSYLSLSVEKEIKGIQATENDIFIITIDGSDNQIFIYKFEIGVDRVFDSPFIYYINDFCINNHDDTIKFIISRCNQSNTILLYGVNGDRIYTGKLHENERKVCLQEAIKLKEYFGNKNLTFSLKTDTNSSGYTKYIGVVWNYKQHIYNIFEYYSPLDQNHEPKFHQNIASIEIEGIPDINDLAIFNATVKFGVTTKKEYLKNIYFLSIKSNNSIYIIWGVESSYIIIDWTEYLRRGFHGLLNKQYFNAICEVGKHLLLLGNTDNSKWGIFAFPYYKSRIGEIKTMNIQDQYLFDS